MKKNYLKSYSTTKTAKKTSKKATKKNAAQLREDNIMSILNMMSEICEYVKENLCTEPAQFEELEWKLRECIK